MEIMKINLDTVIHGLSDKEQQVLEEVKQKYFSNIGNVCWDSGIWDLDIYNKTVRGEMQWNCFPQDDEFPENTLDLTVELSAQVM